MIHVAAGAILNARGEVLLARRAEHLHQGGLWEFPGGKLEPGESPAEALGRELAEELGIRVTARSPLIQVRHHYADRGVLLEVYRVTGFSGEPSGREGQPLAWVPLDELPAWSLPAADRPVVTALRLPDRYLITPPEAPDPEAFLRSLERALARGIRLVQFRLFDPEPRRLLGLARESLQRCREAGARMLLHGGLLPLMGEVAADGVHLGARQLGRLRARPLPPEAWVAASCHSAAELARAAELGLDFAVLSPVLPTRSHPGAKTIGWEGFAEQVAGAGLPVFALGGMREEMVAHACERGGQGIAAIRGLWARGD